MVHFGNTQVLCMASVLDEQPRWLRGTGSGWITAEYDMLPRATAERRRRDRQGPSARSQEIQRLIGRSLRRAVSLELLKSYTITLDCDVLRADGGTRTASVTGACVALIEALKHCKGLPENPLIGLVSAVSVGLVQGQAVLDMDYAEDSVADADINLVMTESGEIVELQATGEKANFSRRQLDAALELGQRGCAELHALQKQALQQ